MKHITTRAYPDLKTWRKAQGINQRDAGKLLGISQTYYSRLERRSLNATGPRAKGIMAKTGVPLEILVGAA
jgi:transcriptional regulator with XRE-family HTH domain